MEEDLLKFSFNILGIPTKLLRVFKLLLAYEELTIKELAQHLKVSIRTVYNYIVPLMKHGLIKRVPSEKDGRLVYKYSPIPREELVKLVKKKLDKYMEVLDND